MKKQSHVKAGETSNRQQERKKKHKDKAFEGVGKEDLEPKREGGTLRDRLILEISGGKEGGDVMLFVRRRQLLAYT